MARTELGDEAVPVGAVAQVCELEQGVVVATFLRPLVHNECRKDAERDDDRHRAHCDRPRRRPQRDARGGERLLRDSPAVGGALAEAEHEQEHAGRDQERAHRVDLRAPSRPLALLHEHQRAEHRERRNDHVDAERPAPRVVRREEATDHGARRGREPGRGAPRREGGRPLATLERHRQDRERRRQHERRADAFDDRLAEHELGHVRRDRRDERPDAEQCHADDEDSTMAVDVAEAAADDQERRERECIARHDPLQLRQRRVEVAQDRRDRDVEYRRCRARR